MEVFLSVNVVCIMCHNKVYCLTRLSLILINFSDASPGLSHNNTSPITGVTLALVATIASLGLIMLVMLTTFITVIVMMARMKAKLQAELRQVKTNVLYDEIGLPPSIDTSVAKNIAYDCVKK